MKIKLSLLSLIVLAVVSCGKDHPDPVSPGPADSYFNTASGSTWNYHSVDNSGLAPATDYTLTSTSRDSSINGKSYHVYTNSSGSNQYLALTGHDYYQFDSLPTGLGAGAIERLYLKDDAAVTGSWVQNLSVTIPGTLIPIPVTITNTIMEKGISRTVNGTAYTDVIHVSTKISSSLIPAASLSTDINSYYALKYGLIENSNVVHLNFSGIVQDLDTETKLVSATLK